MTTNHEPFPVSVLYVEDDAETREEISLIVSRRVREVFSAANGEEGLALFLGRRPELVITDIRMPVMDGLQMIKKIREADRRVKVIVTTAFNELSYLHDAIELGVNRFVLKPINLLKLHEAIHACAENIMNRACREQYLAERERLIAELQAALDKVKLLSGLLPICSGCKKIRDDQGYWQQIEAYIMEHSEASFTHGLCQDCAKRLFPDEYAELYPGAPEKT